MAGKNRTMVKRCDQGQRVSKGTKVKGTKDKGSRTEERHVTGNVAGHDRLCDKRQNQSRFVREGQIENKAWRCAWLGFGRVDLDTPETT